jgi:hypothetical protein
VFAPSRPSCVCCCCCCLLSQQQPQPARSPRDRRSTLSRRGRTAAASTQRGCWARRSDLQTEPPVSFSHSTVTSKSRQPVWRPPRRASLAPTAQRSLTSPRLPSPPPSHPPSHPSRASRHGRSCLCCNLLQAQVVGLSEDVERNQNLPTLPNRRPPACPPARGAAASSTSPLEQASHVQMTFDHGPHPTARVRPGRNSIKFHALQQIPENDASEFFSELQKLGITNFDSQIYST